MYLTSVRVRNFRNLQDFSLQLNPGLNVLLGENNIGKTNLLAAVRVALGSAATGDFIRLGVDDLYREMDGTRPAASFRVDLVFTGLSNLDRGTFLDALNFDPARPQDSTVSIHFEWTWSERRLRGSQRRWGGDREDAEALVPDDALASLQVIFLEALRDAERALAPGNASRLARLLVTLATDEQRRGITQIIADANSLLESDQLVKVTQNLIREALTGATGPILAQYPSVRSADPRFERVVQALRLVLSDPSGASILAEIDENGLGYNNLLFIATVLSELSASPDAGAKLLLIEEPEAHLHPQLQVLLADYLQRRGERVQVLITSHSPTIASRISPDAIHLMHAGDPLRCVSLSECELSPVEVRKLQRMLDVTRASLLFGKGLILVEGISEALLLPALARRCVESLEHRSVSIVQVSGVDFRTLAKLFGENKLRIPVAIITDGDPKTEYATEGDWKTGLPRRTEDDVFEVCERTRSLLARFEGDQVVRVFKSDVTLEYDLAAASTENAQMMVEAWESCFDVRPQTLNQEILAGAGTLEEKALLIWRGICLAKASRTKAEFAQALAAMLEPHLDAVSLRKFEVPQYIVGAFRHAAGLNP